MNNIHLLSKYAICYAVFFLLGYLSKLSNSNRLIGPDGPAASTGILAGLQLTGILWLGVIPFFILHYPFSGIVWGSHPPPLQQVFIIVSLAVLAAAAAIKEAGKLIKRLSTCENNRVFSRRFILKYFLYRIAFLFCYETFLRGFLLTDSIQHFGTVPAILLNVALYTLLHAVNDRKEMIACIPFGTVLCSLCIWTDAAWPAIAIHMVFAITYEVRLAQKFSNTPKILTYESIR